MSHITIDKDTKVGEEEIELAATLFYHPTNGYKQEEINLCVLGEPTAQKRHRHVSKGGFTRTYDPSAADKGDFLSIVQKNAPEKPYDCPLHLDLKFYFTRPKGHFKTGKNSHILKDTAPKWHTGRNDVDNLFKFVADSLNKIYWKDDGTICSSTITKEYSDNPRTEITIRPL